MKKNQPEIIVVAMIDLSPEQVPVKDGKIMSSVPTQAYNQGWDNIFGAKREVGQA